MTPSRLALATLLALTVALGPACGGDDGTPSVDSGGPAPDSAGPDGAAAELVPDPGTVMGGEWTDVEPNDSAGQATPVGIVTGPIWAGFVEPYTQISSPTDTDFYVFATGDAASLANVYMQVCWGGAVNLLDLYLYDVVDMHLGSEIASATTTDTSCETIIAAGDGPTILAASSIYVLEMRAAPGLPAAGLPIMYGA